MKAKVSTPRAVFTELKDSILVVNHQGGLGNLGQVALGLARIEALTSVLMKRKMTQKQCRTIFDELWPFVDQSKLEPVKEHLRRVINEIKRSM